MSPLRRVLASAVLCGVLSGMALSGPAPRQVCDLGAPASRLIAANRTGPVGPICHSANFG